MPITLEVRWFENGPLPPNLRDWFGRLQDSPSRTWTDFYLPCADTSLNLKAREGKIQIKRRLAGPSRYSLGPKVTGHVEEWIKWSFKQEENGNNPWRTNQTGLWVPIQKTRRQHTFDADRQSELSDSLPATPPATVKLEITLLSVSDTSGWTLCLETEGPRETLRDTLLGAAEALLKTEVPTPLRADRSFGYTQWLQRHTTISARPTPKNQLPETS